MSEDDKEESHTPTSESRKGIQGKGLLCCFPTVEQQANHLLGHCAQGRAGQH